MQIYVHRNNQQIGPLTETELKAQLASGALSPLDHVWWSGQAMWIPLAQSPFAGTASLSAHFPPAPHGHTSALAVASLVSNLFCGIGSLAAIVLGHMSLSAIKKDPALQGKGFAVAGLAIGYTITLLFIFQIAVVCLVFALKGEVKETYNSISSQMQGDDDSDDSTTNTTPSNSSDTNNPPVITP